MATPKSRTTKALSYGISGRNLLILILISQFQCYVLVIDIDIVNRCSDNIRVSIKIKNYEDKIKEETSGKRKDHRWNASHLIDNVTGISII